MVLKYLDRAALKTKRDVLAAEARIIKTREQKWKEKARSARDKQKSQVASDSYWTYLKLREHRINVVRPEARAALLAWGFLRGTPYSKIEAKVRPGKYWRSGKNSYAEFWKNVLGIVNRFSHGTYIQAEIDVWRENT